MKTHRRTKPHKPTSGLYSWTQAAFSVCFVASSLLTAAQSTPSDPPYTIIDRGAYYRVWQRTLSITNNSTGQITTQVEAYTELADGMHYWKDGAWTESTDLIEVTPNGAEAVHGQMKATFNGDITSPGAISLTTAGGDVFQSHPLGLFYFDSAVGKVAKIATVQSCQAVLYPPNALVFSNVLKGLKADLVLIWAKNGCEQNLVIKQRLPLPESFGLSSGTTHLQFWSALDRFPVPQRQRIMTFKPGLVDHILDFADSWFPVGSAIEFGSRQVPTDGHAAAIRPIDPAAPGTVPVAKSLVDIAGQKVLVEEVNFDDLQALLMALPQAATTHPSGGVVALADRGRLLSGVPALKSRGLPIHMASSPYSQSGLALDWQQLSGSASSFSFAANTTYYIPTSFAVNNSATFGANVCVKFAYGAYFMLDEATISLPATGPSTVFTSVDDDGYGDPITGISTGNPSYAAAQEIWVYNRPTQTTIQNALFRWAQQAVHYTVESGGASQYLNSSLFQNSSTGAYLDMPNTYLYLSGDIYCNVGSPTIVNAGSLSGSMTLDCRNGPGWDGLASQLDGVAPPDVGGAAGPYGIVQTVNDRINYVNKDGSAKAGYGYPQDIRSMIPANQKTDTFCGSGQGYPFWADPKVIYDSAAGRFYVIEEENCSGTGSSRVHVLVSTSNDPNVNQWNFFWFSMYEQPGNGNTYIGDYPGLGIDANALYITYNMFDSVHAWPPYFCQGAMAYNSQVMALNKALFPNPGGGQVAPTTRKYTPANNPGDQANGFSLQPATPVGGSPGNVAYFAETPQADFTHVRIWLLSDPLGAGVLSSSTAALPNGNLGNSTLGWQLCTAGAPQPGTRTLSTVEGNRTLGNAFWYNGSVWFCATAGGTNAAKAYWFRVNVSNFPTLTADFGRIDPGSGIWTFYPTIGANAHGSICLVYSQSSATQNPSICYTWRTASDTSFRAPQTLKVSGYSYTSSENPGRWGDFATVTIDPVNYTFWVAHEYAHSATQDDWGTWWNNLAAP